ncbi:hypothetical protein [Streptomyces sp. NPDC047968]
MAYVLALLALMVALVVAISASPPTDTDVRSAGVSGSSRAS